MTAEKSDTAYVAAIRGLIAKCDDLLASLADEIVKTHNLNETQAAALRSMVDEPLQNLKAGIAPALGKFATEFLDGLGNVDEASLQ